MKGIKCLGSKYIHYDGIKWIKTTTNRYATADKHRIQLHRYIWEKFMYKIPEGYVVHHLDFNPMNNVLSNLCIMSKKSHDAYHLIKRQKGVPRSEETKRKLSESQIGRKYPPEKYDNRRGMIPWNKGLKFSTKVPYVSDHPHHKDGDVWQVKTGRWYVRENNKTRGLRKSELHKYIK